MNEQTFEIVLLATKLLLYVGLLFVVPPARRALANLKGWLVAETEDKQEKRAKDILNYFVRMAEEIYRKSGQGKLKKEYVKGELKKANVNEKLGLSEEQLDLMIDMVVAELNRKGWLDPVEVKVIAEPK